MYKHGKPTYKLTNKPIFWIAAFIIGVGGGVYFFLIRPNSTDKIKNNDGPRTTVIKDSATGDTIVSMPLFSFSLPGKWKLTSTDWDARYHGYMWDGADKRNNGRKFDVYVDRLPLDQSLNMVLPVKVDGGSMSFGSLSDNCIDFTPGQSTPTETMVKSKWEQVEFWCNYANPKGQLIGTSTAGGINTVTLTGPTKGQHKYFFTYQDSGVSPDNGLFIKILSTFKVE